MAVRPSLILAVSSLVWSAPAWGAPNNNNRTQIQPGPFAARAPAAPRPAAPSAAPGRTAYPAGPAPQTFRTFPSGAFAPRSLGRIIAGHVDGRLNPLPDNTTDQPVPTTDAPAPVSPDDQVQAYRQQHPTISNPFRPQPGFNYAYYPYGGGYGGDYAPFDPGPPPPPAGGPLLPDPPAAIAPPAGLIPPADPAMAQAERQQAQAQAKAARDAAEAMNEANADLAKAVTDLDAATARVKQALKDRPDYRAALAEKQAADRQALAMRAGLNDPDNAQGNLADVLPVAQRGLDAAAKMRRIEAQALAADPQVAEARARVQALVALRRSIKGGVAAPPPGVAPAAPALPADPAGAAAQ